MQLRLMPCKVWDEVLVYLARLDDLRDWPERIELDSQYFTLLLVMDARQMEHEVLISFADRLLDQGLANVHIFGPECEEVHLLFDWARIHRDERGVHHPDAMTSNASEDEDIDEALWFATFVLWPPAEYEAGFDSLLVIVVGHPEWAEHLETRLTDFDRFSQEMDERMDERAQSPQSGHETQSKAPRSVWRARDFLVAAVIALVVDLVAAPLWDHPPANTIPFLMVFPLSPCFPPRIPTR